MLTAEQKQNTIDLVAALRSGNYKYGHGHLKWVSNESESCYCVEGIMCDVLVQKGIAKWERGYTDGSGSIFRYIIGERSWSGALMDTDSVRYFGFPPYLEYNGSNRRFWGLNDRQTLSFNEFADFIEKTYLTEPGP